MNAFSIALILALFLCIQVNVGNAQPTVSKGAEEAIDFITTAFRTCGSGRVSSPPGSYTPEQQEERVRAVGKDMSLENRNKVRDAYRRMEVTYTESTNTTISFESSRRLVVRRTIVEGTHERSDVFGNTVITKETDLTGVAELGKLRPTIKVDGAKLTLECSRTDCWNFTVNRVKWALDGMTTGEVTMSQEYQRRAGDLILCDTEMANRVSRAFADAIRAHGGKEGKY